MVVSGIAIDVQKKNVKNIHLSVLPPDGKVRVSAPLNTSNEAIRLVVIERLAWIKRQIRSFQSQSRQTERSFVSGETHYYLGHAYRLQVANTTEKQSVRIDGGKRLLLSVRKGHTMESRKKLVESWYRDEIKSQVPSLLDTWQPRVGKKVSQWGVKKMKTKWGSCNTDTGSILLNLELIKKPPECLEYILVHELVHLHERNHNDRFRKRLLDLMPDWKERRNLLNSKPLAYNHWVY